MKNRCVYCKQQEGTGNPSCCGDKKCLYHWNNDRLDWEADCMREQDALGGLDE